ncbi:MAG: AraC family transcriptional regulator [Balneolaceae bacterium]
MATVFIAGIIQSFFFALLIGSKKHRTYPDKLLIVWLIIIGLHLLYYFYMFEGWYKQYPAFIGFGLYFPALHGPLFYLYFRALISKKPGWKWKDALHFIPFVVANLFIIQFHFFPVEQKLTLAFSPPDFFSPFIKAGMLLNNFLGPAYIIVIWFYIRKYQDDLKNIFSYTENVSLQWVKNLNYGLAGIWLVVITVNYTPLATQIRGDVFIYTAVVIFVFSVGYFGFKQTALFTDFQNTSPRQPGPGRYTRSGLSQTSSTDILNALIDYLESEKPYLDGTLSLEAVSKALNVPRHHLSEVINRQMTLTFFDLVNRYRVKEFEKRVKAGDISRLTVLGLAYECGFNSKASFNRIFKKQTGQTPSEFIKSIK